MMNGGAMPPKIVIGIRKRATLNILCWSVMTLKGRGLGDFELPKDTTG